MNPEEFAAAVAAAVRQALEDMRPAPQKLLLTSEEASEVTGLPPSFFENEAAAGHLPSRKIGRYRRYSLADIEAIIEACEVPPTSGPYLKRFKQIAARRLAEAA